MILSTIGSGLEALLVWGFSHKLWDLAIFSMLFGATAGGFAVFRPRFASAIVGNDENNEQSLLIFGVLTAMRGVAIIASGFITSAQLNESVKVTSGYGAGKWLHVIVYVGVTMLIASSGALGIFVKGSSRFGKKSNEYDMSQISEEYSQA